MLHLQALAPQTLGLIRALQAEPALRSFALVGGTALALQLGHRLSVDIDLFSREEYDADAILDLLIGRYSFQLGDRSRRTLKGSVGDVMLDMIRHDYPELEVVRTQGLRLLSVRDIAAMKLNAITGNGTRIKDFIDVHFLLERHTLSELVQFYRQKYGQEDCLVVLRSLVYFEDVDPAEWPRLLLHPDLTFEEVKARLVAAVKSLLG